MDYHMLFLNFFLFSKNVDYHMQFKKILSLLQKCGISYAIYRISFPSQKTCTIICNFLNFFHFTKNMDYHIQFMEFPSLLNEHGLSMQFLEFLSPPKTW